MSALNIVIFRIVAFCLVDLAPSRAWGDFSAELNEFFYQFQAAHNAGWNS